MAYVVLFFILLTLLFSYFFYKSYFFQFLLHKYEVKKAFLHEFQALVKGKFISKAYFAQSHKVVSTAEYRSQSNRVKRNFSKCYNIIKFKTPEADWELSFHLIKEGLSFTEVFNLRVFPKKYRIKSEGNVERNYSRINVFTNNHYLTRILEKQANNDLTWLMRYNGDILLISYNNLHFKAFLKDSKRLSAQRVMDMVKAINNIRSEIYKKDVLEY